MMDTQTLAAHLYAIAHGTTPLDAMQTPADWDTVTVMAEFLERYS